MVLSVRFILQMSASFIMDFWKSVEEPYSIFKSCFIKIVSLAAVGLAAAAFGFIFAFAGGNGR